jgi:hypothetical protein
VPLGLASARGAGELSLRCRSIAIGPPRSTASCLPAVCRAGTAECAALERRRHHLRARIAHAQRCGLRAAYLDLAGALDRSPCWRAASRSSC